MTNEQRLKFINKIYNLNLKINSLHIDIDQVTNLMKTTNSFPNLNIETTGVHNGQQNGVSKY